MTAGAAPGRAAEPAPTIFFGSGQFAVPILDALLEDSRVRLVGVVTAPDRPAGRGGALRPTPVALRARGVWVPLVQPARLRDPEAIVAVAALAPELGVLADYGQIVPPELLELPRRGILNVHPSLLPRHRGATPIPAAILAGDTQTGVTIIRMDEGVDTGPIVAARAWPLDGSERAPDLERHAAAEGAQLLSDSLGGWLDGSLDETPQPGAGATVTRQLRRRDARLDPSRSAVDLERRVRALEPWPGAYLETDLGRLGVQRATALPVAASTGSDDAGLPPGTLVERDDSPTLVTTEGLLRLDQVQLEGRRSSAGEEFLRGHRQLLGTKVGVAAARAHAAGASAAGA